MNKLNNAFYLLMKRDKKIAAIKYQIGVCEQKIINKKEIPKIDLDSFLLYRNIPNNRINFDIIKNGLCEQFTIKDIIFNGYALSLSDCYWLYELTEEEYKNYKKIIPNIKWENINAFDNNFNDGYGYAIANAYDYIHNKIKNVDFNSPDCGTNGIQPKYWIIENNKRILYKENFKNNQYIKNEINTLNIARALNKCLEYNSLPSISLIEFTETKNGYKSKCFCKNNEECLSCDLLKIKNIKQLEKLLKKKKILNYKLYIEFLKTILYLSNSYLDFSNIELIRNIDNNKFKMAPLHFSGHIQEHEKYIPKWFNKDIFLENLIGLDNVTNKI